MAIPRVFISSTYYDLKHIRNDIEVFIKSLGYEPVMHDRGKIPYTQSETLEKSCYNELGLCDIVICIIGNKYGTKSEDSDYSITMEELKTALKAKKKIYVFISKDVYIENGTYLANKDNEFFQPVYADNIKIHEFIAELFATVRNHPIKPFENISEIVEELRIQFAGLFHNLLSREASLTEEKTAYDLQETAEEIKEIVIDFSKEKDDFFRKFDSSIFATNFTLKKIKTKLGMQKSTFFASNDEALDEFMSVVGFESVDCDNPFGGYRKYVCKYEDKIVTISMESELFDECGKLKDIRDNNEIDKYLSFIEEENEDENLPF